MKPKYLTTILAAAACLLCSASSLRAQVPQIVDYHGQLLGVDASFDGPVQFKFVLVNSTGTTTYWSNDGTSSAGSQPTNAVTITVNSGLYVVGLGDTTITHMHALPTTVFATSGVYLEDLVQRRHEWLAVGHAGPADRRRGLRDDGGQGGNRFDRQRPVGLQSHPVRDDQGARSARSFRDHLLDRGCADHGGSFRLCMTWASRTPS